MTIAVRTARVTILGNDRTVVVELGENDSVESVMATALRELMLPEAAITHLNPIKNGQDADLTDSVEDGDQIAASGKVANG